MSKKKFKEEDIEIGVDTKMIQTYLMIAKIYSIVFVALVIGVVAYNI